MGAAEDFAKYMERYQAEVPPGPAGDLEMRKRIGIPIVDTSDENVHRPLSDEEIDAWLAYMAWNIWDVFASRSTEGESGLIPRQEYETISFVQMWSRFPALFAELIDTIGVDGLIDLGSTPRREISTQVNATRHYGTPMCTLAGRGIAVSLGLDKPTNRRDDVNTMIQFCRGLQHGLWGGGPGFVSGRNYRTDFLNRELTERLMTEADETPLDDPELRKAMLRFNATTELFGFLMHYDCRGGMCDTGPYPVPGGGFMLVRDHQLHEPAFPWGHLGEGLPWSVTQAMVFRPDEPVQVKINDISTTFTEPKHYLKYISSMAVYVRERWDTPMSEVRRLNLDEINAMTETATAATKVLYRDIANKDRDQKIRDGIHVYLTILTMPYARAAGLWDKWKDGSDLYELDEMTMAAWPALTGGDAAATLAPVFILGQGMPPVSEPGA